MFNFRSKVTFQICRRLTRFGIEQTCFGDVRTIGNVVDHVVSFYSVEVELTQTLGKDNSIPEVSKEAMDKMNAEHASENNQVDRQGIVELLRMNRNNEASAKYSEDV